MSEPFAPKLSILPPAQRRLWDELAQTPEAFTLWGGTALALHLGHRQSIDFDFFTDRAVALNGLLTDIPYLKNATVLQQEPRTLTCAVDRDGAVKLSFFVVPGVLKPIEPPYRAPGNDLKVASLIDLAAMKVKVVQDRAEAKDYIDVDAILTSTPITLAEAISAACAVYGAAYQPLPSLKALAYFDDGNLRALPEDVKQRLSEAVRGLDPLRLPSLIRTTNPDKPKTRDR